MSTNHVLNYTLSSHDSSEMARQHITTIIIRGSYFSNLEHPEITMTDVCIVLDIRGRFYSSDLTGHFCARLRLNHSLDPNLIFSKLSSTENTTTHHTTLATDQFSKSASPIAFTCSIPSQLRTRTFQAPFTYKYDDNSSIYSHGKRLDRSDQNWH